MGREVHDLEVDEDVEGAGVGQDEVGDVQTVRVLFEEFSPPAVRSGLPEGGHEEVQSALHCVQRHR